MAYQKPKSYHFPLVKGHHSLSTLPFFLFLSLFLSFSSFFLPSPLLLSELLPPFTTERHTPCHQLHYPPNYRDPGHRRLRSSLSLAVTHMVSRGHNFLAIFSTIQPLDRHDSTSIQLLVSSAFIPYLDQPLKII